MSCAELTLLFHLIMQKQITENQRSCTKFDGFVSFLFLRSSTRSRCFWLKRK